jgi:hypothetical protein
MPKEKLTQSQVRKMVKDKQDKARKRIAITKPKSNDKSN